MQNDPIASGTTLVAMLVFILAPFVIGGLLLSSGYGKRRRAQIAYLAWLAQNGDGVPENLGLTPLSMYPQEVVSTGRGTRVVGGLLLGFGCLLVLGQLASIANGL